MIRNIIINHTDDTFSVLVTGADGDTLMARQIPTLDAALEEAGRMAAALVAIEQVAVPVEKKRVQRAELDERYEQSRGRKKA